MMELPIRLLDPQTIEPSNGFSKKQLVEQIFPTIIAAHT